MQKNCFNFTLLDQINLQLDDQADIADPSENTEKHLII